MKTDNGRFLHGIFSGKDRFWAAVWVITVGLLGIWDMVFLNRPAFKKVVTGFVNTFVISLIVVAITLLLGWCFTLGLHYFGQKEKP